MWTQRHLQWVKEQVHFEQPAQEYTLLDYVHEVEHVADRIQRLEQAIAEAIKLAPAQMQEVVQALQALRGIAQISAGSIVAETGKDLPLAGGPQPIGLHSAGFNRETTRQRFPTRDNSQTSTSPLPA